MGKIRVHYFISLDGVIDEPSWTADFGFTDGMAEAMAALTDASEAILLGRLTHEAFEIGWADRTEEDDPGAPFFNDSTKYVVSSTLTDPTWRNSEVIGTYSADAIRKLKQDVDGDLFVSGSGTLVKALLADGLVDELHLFLYPLTRGEGPRLFENGAAPLSMELAKSTSFDNGVVYLDYRARS